MRSRRAASAAMLFITVATGCVCTRPVPLIDDEKLLSKVNAGWESMLDAAKPELAPLKTLSKPEKKAVLTAIAVTRALSIYQASMVKKDKALIERSRELIGSHLAGFKRVVGEARALPCFDENLAYASGMASCLKDENKTEEQCERENAAAAAAAVGCMMKALLEIERIIPRLPDLPDIPGRGRGPGRDPPR